MNYTGQRLDGTGLLYYHARMYDPGLGRFVSPDTTIPEEDNPQAANRYSYVYNSPLRYTDPSGYCRYEQDERGRNHFVYAEDCTVDEYNQLSWDDHLLWADTFAQNHGLQGWFDDIKVAIEGFRDNPAFNKQNGWASYADAAVLQGIQNGMRLKQGQTMIGEHAGNQCLASCVQAGVGWTAFYQAEERHQQTKVEPDNLYTLRYGAEQGGVDYGTEIARGRAAQEPFAVRAKIIQFVFYGN